MQRLASVQGLEQYRQALVQQRDTQKSTVNVCMGTGCSAMGAEQVFEAFKKELSDRGLTETIGINPAGCRGFCERGPVVVIDPQKIFYQQVKESDVGEVIEQTLLQGTILERLLYRDLQSGHRYEYEKDVPFYKKQMRVVMRDNGLINPTKIEDYIARGGYEALAKVLITMKPEETVDVVEKSGLRGRGGAGFPTGLKWRFCRNSPGDRKFIICNGDEGDPGAFMDRTLLEGNPHLILEGMMVGAYAIGANKGYLYVRAEYPTAVRHLQIGIAQCYDLGLLGKNILGSGFDLDLELMIGAGAFVCGEETALMCSIEGNRGMPRLRPPFPAQSGLWGYPTNINNVETWANVRNIIMNGWEWYAGIGTEKSKGTKIFSLTGRINNTGLIEVPMGIKLADIVNEIGGGIPKGKKLKAVQTGGPSGGCIPGEMLDLSVDYESLAQVGSIMGSGGMVVMDEDTCMVDTARYFLSFTQSESCGKCIPCRLGTKQMLDILEDICQGRGKPEDLDLLRYLSEAVQKGSLCGLGQTAPNPVITTLRYFQSEYQAHILEKRCPAGVCKPLTKFFIDEETCTGCTLCAKNCPAGAVTGEKKKPHQINQDLCIKCRVCYEGCKFDAVKIA
jgi:NADH-quinone oxidoreductase subunit F